MIAHPQGRQLFVPIDDALADAKLLGAALGDAQTWQTSRVVLKAAFGLELNRRASARIRECSRFPATTCRASPRIVVHRRQKGRQIQDGRRHCGLPRSVCATPIISR